MSCLLYYVSGQRVPTLPVHYHIAGAPRLLNPYFLLIALFDPHLHCIPSLHVLTICYNYHQTRKIVMKLGPIGKPDCRAGSRRPIRLALRITEADPAGQAAQPARYRTVPVPALPLVSRLRRPGDPTLRLRAVLPNRPSIDPGAPAAESAKRNPRKATRRC